MDRKVSRWLISCYMCVDSLIWLIYLQIQISLRSNRFLWYFRRKKEMFGKRAKSKSEVSSHFSLYRNKSSLRKVLCIPSQACSRLKNQPRLACDTENFCTFSLHPAYLWLFGGWEGVSVTFSFVKSCRDSHPPSHPTPLEHDLALRNSISIGNHMNLSAIWNR